ncbi:fumarate reductase subunit C [Ramlibacter albus]|uniref:Fumarate reductase subunit C n=1 Tax=Ramlibacter albus TaxID=2079448 RepID=A0A923M992_9BURK|nr:fumarate reductase subunit C [Ramlibacter albus]MBC5766021.1 fumarate reductase subunit C [Ramlibacter albus]
MSYVRPMAGWWKRDPFFVRYMARELTAFAVLAYAVVLAVGLVRLAQGELAYNGWLRAVQSPAGLVMHLVFFVSFLVHCTSWFEIMPKTMPMMVLGGKRVSAAAITGFGTGLAVVVTLAVLAVARWLP